MSKWSTEYIDALPNSSFAYVSADGSRHLPFKNTDGRVDLPHVRDALARLSQVNMSATERQTVKDKLQGSLKASDADDDVMSFVSAIEASDGNGLPQRMMLLRAGVFNTQKYGEVPLAAADLQQMVDNFKAGVGMAGDGSTGIPVDYAHQSNLNAAAWIKDMAVENSDELWATSIEWSGSGRKAIQDKEYKCLSSDFYPAAFGEWVDAESGVSAKNVIVGAALTNRPMFTGNQPVVTASETHDGERQITKYLIANEKEQSMDINAIRVKAADDVTVQEQRFLQANASELSAEERTKFEIAEPVKADDKKDEPKVIQASSVKGDEGLVAVQAAELKGLNDKIESLSASEEARTKASMEAEVDKAIKRGAIKADRKDSYVGRLVASSESDRKELLADLEAMSDNPALAATQGSGDGDETSTTGAREKLMAMATEVVRKSDGKTDIRAALATVKAENPELVEASAAERTAVLTASDAEFKAAGVNRG